MFCFGDPGGRIYTSAGTGNANFLAHWTATTTVGGTTIVVSASNGRLTGSCLRITNNANNQVNLVKTLSSQTTWGVAFAIKISALPTLGRFTILTFEDTSAIQLGLSLNPNGTLQFDVGGTTPGTTGTLVGSASTATLTINTWTHFEVKVTINNTTGSIELRQNGVAIIGPTTSLNTRTTSNNSANAVRLGTVIAGGAGAGTWSSATIDLDDFIIWDSQTTDANGFADIHDFIGDCNLTWLLPTGAGTTTQFTPDSGSNYARVNEATPDGDTSYVQDGTVGHIDTYAMADLGGTVATVKSVAAVLYVEKTDSGSRGVKTELRSNSGNTAHATEISLGNSYQYQFQTWGQDPNNGSAIDWTPTTVNALEVGQKVSS